MSNPKSVATINLTIELNLALLEYQSHTVLNRWNESIEDYTQQELITAWTKAVQLHLERQAESTDHFLACNGNEEVFLDALAVA